MVTQVVGLPERPVPCRERQLRRASLAPEAPAAFTVTMSPFTLIESHFLHSCTDVVPGRKIPLCLQVCFKTIAKAELWFELDRIELVKVT